MIIIVYLLIAVALMMLYMVKVANEHHILQHSVRVNGQQDSLKIVFISDVHNRKIVHKQLALLESADAVVIGGDFCDKRTSEKTLLANITLLKSFGPIYFVWGNNDREFGEAQLREILANHHITIVENDAVLLPNRTNNTWIAAIDDTSMRNYSFEKALHKCADHDITICVSHNPQVFHLAREVKRISLLMGGHLHGGQIRLGRFGLHPHGSFSIRHGVATLISNGYGTTLLPFRLGAKPQLHVIHMEISHEKSE